VLPFCFKSLVPIDPSISSLSFGAVTLAFVAYASSFGLANGTSTDSYFAGDWSSASGTWLSLLGALAPDLISISSSSLTSSFITYLTLTRANDNATMTEMTPTPNQVTKTTGYSLEQVSDLTSVTFLVI